MEKNINSNAVVVSSSKALFASFGRFLDNAQRREWTKNAVKHSAVVVYHWEVAGLKMSKGYYVTMKLGKIIGVKPTHSNWSFDKLQTQGIVVDKKPEVGQYLSKEMSTKFEEWKGHHTAMMAV